MVTSLGRRHCESVQQEGVDQEEHFQLVRRGASALLQTFPALTKSTEEGRTGDGRWEVGRGDVGGRGVKWGVVARGGGGGGKPVGPPSPPAPARCRSTLIALTRTIYSTSFKLKVGSKETIRPTASVSEFSTHSAEME